MNLSSTIRFALRQMGKRWILSTAAALSLALCLGLNSAIFSVFNAVLLRPLPFPEPDRVVEIYNSYPDGGLDKGSSNIELYTVYKEQVPAVERYALVGFESLTFGSAEGAQRILGMRLSVDALDTLGLQPFLGQPFQPENGLSGSDNVVLLTHSFWQSAFAGDPDIIDGDIDLNGRSYTVTGVLPPAFRRFNANPEVVVPFAWNPAEIDLSRRHLNYAMLLGRLAEGATIGEAQSQVDAVDAAYREENPQAAAFLQRAGHRSYVLPHAKERVASIQSTLYLLNAFALAILIIGALNIANLRFAEVASRERELTIRRAMGGSKRQLVKQMLLEAGLLGVIGGALGLVTAYFSLGLLRNSFSGIVDDLESIQLDGTVIGWALLLVVGVILIIGLSPVRLLGRLNLQSLLQESGRGSAGGRGTALRSSLGVVQTGLAVVLLIATGLFVRSFWNATQVDPGFDAHKLHTFRVPLPETRFPDSGARIAMVRRILDELSGLPGVESVTGTSAVPVITGMGYLTFTEFGDDPMDQGEQKAADNFFITEDFFRTMGIPILNGRGIELQDQEDAPVVYVADATMEQRFLGAEPIGARMTFGSVPDEGEPWPTVIGTVPRIIHRDLTDVNQAPLVYRSFYQNPRGSISFLLRSDRDHETLLSDIRTVTGRLDSNLPIYRTGRLDELIENSLQERKAVMGLTTLFAIVAFLLAIAGIYGVQAYNVQAGLRTLAIRAALGATPAVLLKRTLSRGLIPVAIGLAFGIGMAGLLAPKAESMVYAVNVRDPLTMIIVSALVLFISAAAISIPARSAARANPARILHEE